VSCVDCEITVDCQCDVSKKKKHKKLGYGKPFFKALGNSLYFKSPLFILSQSPRSKKSQTPNPKPDSWQLYWAW